MSKQNMTYRDVVEYLIKYIRTSAITNKIKLTQSTRQVIDDLVDDINDGVALSDEKERADAAFNEYIDGLSEPRQLGTEKNKPLKPSAEEITQI